MLDEEQYLEKTKRRKQIIEDFRSVDNDIPRRDADIVADALMCVPEDVYNYIKENVQFQIGEHNQFALNDGDLGGGMVYLNNMSGKREALHEIAHAYKKHIPVSEGPVWEKQESEAIRLAKGWEENC